MLKRFLVSRPNPPINIFLCSLIRPALNMLSESVTPETKTIIEYSSGSTVLSLSILARIFHGISDTRAFLSNKTSEAKLQLMQFFGLDM